MNQQTELAKLEKLREVMEAYNQKKYGPGEDGKSLHEKLVRLHGEVEHVIERIEGRERIEVATFGKGSCSTFPNYIEAGYLSGRTFHRHKGYTQLLKVIGKMRVEPSQAETTPGGHVPELGSVLRRLWECCHYLTKSPTNERAVQNIVRIMIRASFDRVHRDFPAKFRG